MPFSQMMFDMVSDIYDHFGRSFITFIVCRYYLTSRTPIVIVQHYPTVEETTYQHTIWAKMRKKDQIGKTMHCLPQRHQHFWNFFEWRLEGLRRQPGVKKKFKVILQAWKWIFFASSISPNVLFHKKKSEWIRTDDEHRIT